jgi:hypothetical protein
MLKQLTRKLFILFALVAYIAMAAPSTPAQASGYLLSGTVQYYFNEVVESPAVYIYKWNGSSYAFHGMTYGDSCGAYTYDTGGPGEFFGIVSGQYPVKDAWICGWSYNLANVLGSSTAEVSVENPSAYMDIFTMG